MLVCIKVTAASHSNNEKKVQLVSSSQKIIEYISLQHYYQAFAVPNIATSAHL